MFLESETDLNSHFSKEENIVFPFIKTMVQSSIKGTELMLHSFQSVENPINIMKEEHAEEGERLRVISQLSNSYTWCSYINWKRFRPKGYKGKHNNWGDCREDIGYFCKGNEPKTFHKQYIREAGLSAASKKRFEKIGRAHV